LKLFRLLRNSGFSDASHTYRSDLHKDDNLYN
jgi:hypothetical protein